MPGQTSSQLFQRGKQFARIKRAGIQSPRIKRPNGLSRKPLRQTGAGHPSLPRKRLRRTAATRPSLPPFSLTMKRQVDGNDGKLPGQGPFEKPEAAGRLAVTVEAEQKTRTLPPHGVVKTGIANKKMTIRHAKYIRAKSTDSYKKIRLICRKSFILH